VYSVDTLNTFGTSFGNELRRLAEALAGIADRLDNLSLRRFHMEPKYLGGETALVVLHGTMTENHGPDLLRLIDVLLANDYVDVVVDATKASVPPAGRRILIEARRKGATLLAPKAGYRV
jgi:hypothetical protein